MNLDGGSLFYVYSFLKDLNDSVNTKIINFRISKEDLILKKTFYESYENYNDFYTKHFEILRYRPFCETGAYFRISNFKVQIVDSKNNKFELVVYFDNNNVITKTKAPTSLDVFTNIVNKAKNFIPKIEYVIQVRKDRYVEPCYVDDNYIDEKFPTS